MQPAKFYSRNMLMSAIRKNLHLQLYGTLKYLARYVLIRKMVGCTMPWLGWWAFGNSIDSLHSPGSQTGLGLSYLGQSQFERMVIWHCGVVTNDTYRRSCKHFTHTYHGLASQCTVCAPPAAPHQSEQGGGEGGGRGGGGREGEREGDLLIVSPQPASRAMKCRTLVIHARTCMHTHTHACTHTRTHACMHTCTHTHAPSCTYKHTHTNIPQVVPL